MVQKKNEKKATENSSIPANPENLFGMNAGKVWVALSENRSGLTVGKIGSITRLSTEGIWGGLGWLGREGKIRIENGKFFLNE